MIMTNQDGLGTLLLIDDDHAVRGMLKEILHRSGYNVIEAVDGEDGVNAFTNNMHCVNLVITDVVMPKKNGKQVFDEVRKLKEDAKVLFMSGYPLNILDNRLTMDRRMDFIAKPLSPKDLLHKIRFMLDN
ncbi:MAG: response regulator [Nitrospirae bacterium]|nr:response regulator [Nitrospirota bacterium]